MFDFDPAAREVARLLDGVTEDHLTGPTPCADMSVATLLDHFMGLTLGFTSAARKTGEADGNGGRPDPKAENLDPQWRELLPQRLDDLAKAWLEQAAWEGDTFAGGVTLPAGQMAVIALDELVLHGWDLARATGQEFRCDPVSAEVVLAFTTAAAEPEFAPMRAGLFGDVVAVPDGAPVLDKALGLAGRDPNWTPA
jgi:uncharacterized protein (TIGR03086 family)